jgi:hypothetical protein
MLERASGRHPPLSVAPMTLIFCLALPSLAWAHDCPSELGECLRKAAWGAGSMLGAALAAMGAGMAVSRRLAEKRPRDPLANALQGAMWEAQNVYRTLGPPGSDLNDGRDHTPLPPEGRSSGLHNRGFGGKLGR